MYKKDRILLFFVTVIVGVCWIHYDKLIFLFHMNFSFLLQSIRSLILFQYVPYFVIGIVCFFLFLLFLKKIWLRCCTYVLLHLPYWISIPNRSTIFRRAPLRFEYGWVYVMTNSTMPGLVKVGTTQVCPRERAKQLRGTGVATPFKIIYVQKCGYAARVESQAHRILHPFRVDSNREFFKCAPKIAIKAVKLAQLHVKGVR